MTAETPYRSADIGPRYICVVCFKCSALAEEACAECRNKMCSLRDEEVSTFVVDRANARIDQSVRRQIIFALIFVVPCFLTLWIYDMQHPLPMPDPPSYRGHFGGIIGKNARQSVTIVPIVLFLVLVFVHPFLFNDRIGRKYRASVSTVDRALDVLGTRPQ